ncbi:MAG: NDP-hexose 3,4-dehydratase [Candidatus Daviesbacteria bacterium GW2011_GWB1_39_5]|nr:MAG: NDP-hexose 3,4-dehydratase [Candidatus Daviesbacteria bacterium GW2011_GWB1_39_5]
MKSSASDKKDSLRLTTAIALHGKEEEERVLKVLREHRTIMGREIEEFERRLAKIFEKEYGIMVNSGSSANLLAIELLNLPPGTEVITPILTFSTTVAPLIQKGLVPVFVDVLDGKYVIDADKVEAAISKKTKALMVPILMGNVPNLEKLQKIAKKHNLYYIDDSCDAITSLYKGKSSGAYSDISTTSVYGSHVITAGGNGGVVMVNKEELRDKAKVLRGWGRSSAIFSESEKIEYRFSSKIGNIPYDGKYIFEEIGYNFLPMELGAAFGNAQLDKLKLFIKIRERNAKILSKLFGQYPDLFIVPIEDEQARPQRQVFPVTIKKGAPFTRLELVTFLEKENVQTRPIFTGNILKQPGFKNITHRDTQKDYEVTDNIMERGFIIGVHQGLTLDHLDKLSNFLHKFIKQF